MNCKDYWNNFYVKIATLVNNKPEAIQHWRVILRIEL